MSEDTGEHEPPTIHVEWDEPGAGGIVINGERVIDFGIKTDWSDHWNPHVSRRGLWLMDVLPRLVQERENAYATARKYADDLRTYLAEADPSGRSGGSDV